MGHTDSMGRMPDYPVDLSSSGRKLVAGEEEMNDNELPCSFCGNPVELSEYNIYRQATGDGICGDCYFHEQIFHSRFDANTDKMVAMAEADALRHYLEDLHAEMRLRELDKQHKAEGGK